MNGENEKERVIEVFRVRIRIGKNSSTHGILCLLLKEGTLTQLGATMRAGVSVGHAFSRLMRNKLIYVSRVIEEGRWLWKSQTNVYRLTPTGELVAERLPAFEGWQVGWKGPSYPHMAIDPYGGARVREWFNFDVTYFKEGGENYVRVIKK